MTEPKHSMKHALVIDLLSTPNGATIEDIMTATGWQHNSTRGMLTGLRKRKFEIASEKIGGVRRYRLNASPTEQ